MFAVIAYSSNVLDPQSPQARAMYHLGQVSLVVFVLIWLIVTSAIIIAIVRFRGRPGDADPRQIAGKKKVTK